MPDGTTPAPDASAAPTAARLPTRILGVDLGDRRVGVAKTDPSGSLASPLCVIQRSTDRTLLGRELAALIDEWEIELVVIGLPRSLDGSLGPAGRKAQAEIRHLGDTLSVPVETYDERLTTVTAEQLLRQAQHDSRAQRKSVDMVAAAVILQGWLERQHHMHTTLPTDTDG